MATITVRNETSRRTWLRTLKAGLTALCEEYNAVGRAIDVLLTDDAEMARLNAEFRGKDEPTDVLTFPGPDWPGAPLGDIAVSISFAERGARARNVPVHHELAYLAIHGGLHLLGYDDQTESEREDMIERMNAIAVKIGIQPDLDWASQPH